MANEDFTSQLIKSLNKDYKTKVAYNLSEDESPTQVNTIDPGMYYQSTKFMVKDLCVLFIDLQYLYQLRYI